MMHFVRELLTVKSGLSLIFIVIFFSWTTLSKGGKVQ